jgi:hypothetical protein
MANELIGMLTYSQKPQKVLIFGTPYLFRMMIMIISPFDQLLGLLARLLQARCDTYSHKPQ